MDFGFGCISNDTTAPGVFLATEKCSKSDAEKEQMGGLCCSGRRDKKTGKKGCPGLLMAATDSSRKVVWRRWRVVIAAVELLVHPACCTNPAVHIRTNRGP